MLSFIIPAHNEEAVLPATLDSLHQAAQAAGRPYEVIVVDDASTDRTATLAAGHGARIVPVQLRHIAAVRNAGARQAQGDILIFVDADTLVPAGTLTAALAALDHGAVGGGALVGFDQPLRLPVRPIARVWDALSRCRRWAAGCFIFVRREAFEAVGGFDETYFVSEEIHLSKALKRQGRFLILRQRVITSARKVRLYGAGRLFLMTLALLLRGPGAWRRREGLWMWYEGRRES